MAGGASTLVILDPAHDAVFIAGPDQQALRRIFAQHPDGTEVEFVQKKELQRIQDSLINESFRHGQTQRALVDLRRMLLEALTKDGEAYPVPYPGATPSRI